MSQVNASPTMPYRQLQALETKRRIAQAARRVFAAGGYAASSLELVAREAGVAPRTVYAAFGTKKQILAAICDEWLAEANVGGLAREIMAEPDPRKRLSLVARVNRRQWELGRDVLPMLEAAAASDADVAQMLQEWKDRRAEVLREAVKALRKHLREGVTSQGAAATVRALSAAEIYSELTGGEKWSPDRYEEWLSGLLAAELLGSPR
jgi:AcrR family transcriptional regulator